MGVSYKNEIRVWCELGCILVSRSFSKTEDDQSRIEVFNNSRLVEEILIRLENHFVNMINSFLKYISLDKLDQQYDHILDQSFIMQKIRDNK